jgi:hypothetical protein
MQCVPFCSGDQAKLRFEADAVGFEDALTHLVHESENVSGARAAGVHEEVAVDL